MAPYMALYESDGLSVHIAKLLQIGHYAHIAIRCICLAELRICLVKRQVRPVTACHSHQVPGLQPRQDAAFAEHIFFSLMHTIFFEYS